MFKTASKGVCACAGCSVVGGFSFLHFFNCIIFFNASAVTRANKKSVFVCLSVYKLAISYHKVKNMESGIQL